MTGKERNRVAIELDAWEARVLKQSADLVEAGVAAAGDGPTPLAIVVVPSQCRPLIKATKAARERFADHLRSIVLEAFETDPGPPPSRVDAEQGGLMDAACRLCRGKCCVSGMENNAHLQTEDIQRYRRDNPGTGPDEVHALYMSLVAEDVTLGGCFYQGPTGCTLPRTLRSEICNTFMCRGQNLLRAAEDNGADTMILVSSNNIGGVAAATWDPVRGYADVDPGVSD